MTKVITDFTGLTHFRHPYELGGIYFAFNLFTTPIASFWLASHYVRFTEENPEGLTIVFSERAVYSVIGGLTLAQLAVFFLFFLRCMNPNYTHTFYSTKSGNDNACDYFLQHESDEGKIRVINDNKHKWARIAPDVAKWIDERWPVWEESQPPWLNEKVKDKISDFMNWDKHRKSTSLA